MSFEGVINYTGNKSKLMPLLNSVFKDSKANRLVDVCCGGLSVTLHSQFDNVLSNDIHTTLIDIYKLMASNNYETINNEIESRIKWANLSRENKEQYFNFRDFVNGQIGVCRNVTLMDFLTLQYHSFSNMIRFNEKGGFNVAFGQRTYNKSSQGKLRQFYDVIQKKNIEFSNESFEDLVIKPTDCVYIDPPYLITHAVYNQGWDAESDKKMMDWLDELNRNGVEFVMSNVIAHRGKTNDALIQWARKYRTMLTKHQYVFNSYHAKDQDKETVEVIITNIKG